MKKMVEFFKSVMDRNSHHPMTINEVRHLMKSDKDLKNSTLSYRNLLIQGDEESLVKAKWFKPRLFPAVQFAGTFSGTGKIEEFKEFSGFLVLDVDHCDVAAVDAVLRTDPYVRWFFPSVSGDGVKIIIEHNLSDDKKWPYLYYEIAYHFKEKYGIICDNTPDIARMCFLPFITSEIEYYNENSALWEYMGDFEDASPDDEIPAIIDECRIEKCRKYGQYIKKANVVMCDDYNIWYRLGFSLATIGEHGRQIFHDISSTSKKYSKKETDEKYDHFLSSIDESRTGITFYEKMCQYAISEYAIMRLL